MPPCPAWAALLNANADGADADRPASGTGLGLCNAEGAIDPLVTTAGPDDADVLGSIPLIILVEDFVNIVRHVERTLVLCFDVVFDCTEEHITIFDGYCVPMLVSKSPDINRRLVLGLVCQPVQVLVQLCVSRLAVSVSTIKIARDALNEALLVHHAKGNNHHLANFLKDPNPIEVVSAIPQEGLCLRCSHHLKLTPYHAIKNRCTVQRFCLITELWVKSRFAVAVYGTCRS